MIYLSEFRSSPWGVYYNGIDFLGLFLEGFLFIYLVTSILKTRLAFLKSVAGQLLSALLLAVLYFVTSILSEYRYEVWFLTIFISCLLYVVLFFEGGLYKKLLLSSVYCCTAVALDSMSFSIVFFHVQKGQINVALFTVLFVMRRLLFKILLAICVRFYIKNDVDTMIKTPVSYLFCLIFLACVESVWILMTPQLFQGYGKGAFQIFNCAVTIVVLLSVYYLFGATAKYYQENLVHRMRTKEYEVFRKTSLQNEQYIQEVRNMRHDMQAHLFCIHSLLEEGECTEAREYVKTLLEMPLPEEESAYCANHIINMLLQIAKQEAKQNQIPFEAQVNLTEALHIANKDLCAVLSNLCSNALTASKAVKEPYIQIKIKTVKAYLSIVAINQMDFDVCQNNPALKTTKSNPDDHGVGIPSIKSIVRKYNGVYKIESSERSFQFNILLENLPS